jgi:hypothetical protein
MVIQVLVPIRWRLFVISLIALLLFGSCVKDAVFEHTSPHPLYYEALLTNYSRVQVHVSPIVSLQEAATLQLTNWAEDLSIYLFEEGVIVDTLTYFGNGIYRGSLSFIPQSGKAYHFEATHDEYPRTVSNRVVIDPTPEVVMQSFGSYRSGHRLRYLIKSIQGEAYYELRYMYRAYPDVPIWPGGIEHLNVSTSYLFDTGCGWNQTIVTNLCHDGLDIPLDMYVSMNTSEITPDRLQLFVDRINEPLFSAERFFDYPTDATEAFGFGVNIQSNLFEEGVGVVFTRTRTTFEFRF